MEKVEFLLKKLLYQFHLKTAYAKTFENFSNDIDAEFNDLTDKKGIKQCQTKTKGKTNLKANS